MTLEPDLSSAHRAAVEELAVAVSVGVTVGDLGKGRVLRVAVKPLGSPLSCEKGFSRNHAAAI